VQVVDFFARIVLITLGVVFMLSVMTGNGRYRLRSVPRLSTYNFNGIDYALVRNEVVNRKPAM
jgi:hypothetical protein